MFRPVALLACLAATLAVAGCGDTPVRQPPPVPAAEGPSAQPTTAASGAASPSAVPSPASTPAASPKTLAPPKHPTDGKPVDWVVGRITRGGTGPCYGLVTDDERVFALYSTAGQNLVKDTYVRVRFTLITPKTDCGPGTNVSIVKAEPIG